MLSGSRYSCPGSYGCGPGEHKINLQSTASRTAPGAVPECDWGPYKVGPVAQDVNVDYLSYSWLKYVRMGFGLSGGTQFMLE